jgi:hypothetical protein
MNTLAMLTILFTSLIFIVCTHRVSLSIREQLDHKGVSKEIIYTERILWSG